MIGMNIGAIAGALNATRSIARSSRRRMRMGSWFGFGTPRGERKPEEARETWRVKLQRKLPVEWKVKEFTCYHTYIYFDGYPIATCDDEVRYWRTVNENVTNFLTSIGEQAYLDVPDSSMGMTRTDIPRYPFKMPTPTEAQ